MSLAVGTRFGPYEIVAPLGSGGMGEVYRARDTKLHREVAVKVLPELFARQPERVARFEREAQLLASLNHPNIAQIYGVEESGDVRALVMELVPGKTLGEVIARPGHSAPAAGAMQIDDALAIARQIADALEAAHEKGIIHRDLKPGNVMLTPEGQVKVLDFGLGKSLAPEADADPSNSPTMTAAATQAGVLLGTAAYMAPEQAKGRAADKRSDVWAFGCVLYEMITGRRAFEGEDVSDTLAAILRGEPDWSALPADTPAHVRRVLQQCLQKDRKRRLHDIGDVQLALDQGDAAAATSIVAAPAPVDAPARWRVHLVWLAALVIVGAATGGAVWWLRTPAPAAETRFAFTLPEDQQFTNIGRQLVAISPDGSQFVYVANTRLFLKPMKEVSSTFIPGTEITQGGVLNPVFSPDGRSLAFWSGADQTLKRIAVSGGAPVTVAKVDAPFGMSWGQDDQILVGQGLKGIMVVSANGGKPETVVTVKPPEQAHGPQLLPGGAHVLFTLATTTSADRWDKAQIVVQSLKTGERKIVVEGGSDARYLPTGHLVYALAGTLLAVPFDAKRLAVSGGTVPMIEGVQAATATGTSQFSVADNGSLVYIPGTSANSVPQRTLALVDRSGSPKPLGLPPGPYFFPRVSPNGKQLAFHTDDGKETIVWIYDLDGKSSVRRLTFGGKNGNPIWSADGQRVIYTSDREAPTGLFWQRADGTGLAERLSGLGREESWYWADVTAPDGQTLLLTAFKTGDFSSIWAYSLRDRKASKIIDDPSYQHSSVLSPDGRWVAYESEEKGREVYVQPFPPTGAKYLVTKDGGNHPVWSPDGKELFFMNNVTNGQLYSVSIRTQPSLTFGLPVALAVKGMAQDPGGWRHYDITPDGKQFVVILPPGANANEAKQTLQIQVVLNWFEELKQRVAQK